MEGSFAAFLGVAAVVIVTPGQDTALTIRNTLLGGRAGGVATAVGVALGQASWSLAASVGVTALLVAFEPALMVVRLTGAAYLVFLGAQSLWAAVRNTTETGPGQGGTGAHTFPARRALRQGVLSNLGNPKMAVFFSSLLPQFVSPGSSMFGMMLGLGLVFALMTVIWLSGYAAVVAHAGDVLRGPRVRRMIDAAMGAMLVGFGIRLAAASR